MSMIEVRGKIHSQRAIKIYREKKKDSVTSKSVSSSYSYYYYYYHFDETKALLTVYFGKTK